MNNSFQQLSIPLLLQQEADVPFIRFPEIKSIRQTSSAIVSRAVSIKDKILRSTLKSASDVEMQPLQISVVQTPCSEEITVIENITSHTEVDHMASLAIAGHEIEEPTPCKGMVVPACTPTGFAESDSDSEQDQSSSSDGGGVGSVLSSDEERISKKYHIPRRSIRIMNISSNSDLAKIFSNVAAKHQEAASKRMKRQEAALELALGMAAVCHLTYCCWIPAVILALKSPSAPQASKSYRCSIIASLAGFTASIIVMCGVFAAMVVFRRQLNFLLSVNAAKLENGTILTIPSNGTTIAYGHA